MGDKNKELAEYSLEELLEMIASDSSKDTMKQILLYGEFLKALPC